MVELRFQDERLTKVFRKALALAPEERFQNADALADVFEELLSLLPDQMLYRTLRSGSYKGNACALSDRDTVLVSYKN